MAKLSQDTANTHRFQAEAYRITIGKTGHFIDVKPSALSPEVLEYLFVYGMKQCLNDAAASGKSDDEKTGLANKRWESLLEGKLRQARESDPIAQEARKIATDLVKRKTKLEAGSDEFKAAVAKAMANPAILTLAQQNVERAKKLDIEIEF